MLQDIFFTFLISLSPFGEARAGIPYGELNGLPIVTTFFIGLAGNLLVFPLFYKFIEVGNKYLLKNRFYKKSAIQFFHHLLSKEIIKHFHQTTAIAPSLVALTF